MLVLLSSSIDPFSGVGSDKPSKQDLLWHIINGEFPGLSDPTPGKGSIDEESSTSIDVFVTGQIHDFVRLKGLITGLMMYKNRFGRHKWTFWAAYSTLIFFPMQRCRQPTNRCGCQSLSQVCSHRILEDRMCTFLETSDIMPKIEKHHWTNYSTSA